jgi:hypothetical protein
MRVGTLAALLAAAVLVAGCGSSSSSSGASSTNSKAPKPSTTTKASAPSVTTTASTPSSSSTSTASTSFASDANCLELDGVSAKFEQALASATGAKFDEAVAAGAFQKLADAAPSAIRPDLETVAQAFSAFATAFTKSGYVIGKTPTAAQTAALASAVAVFTQPKLKAAETALQAWGKKNCS